MKPALSLRLTRLLTLIVLISTSLALPAKPLWYWKDSFTPTETEALKEWIRHTEQGLESLLGPVPFDYRVYFHRQSDQFDPVPWARTAKGEYRAVHFFVDTSHPLNDFKSDWTASHELIHLIFPYLGKSGRWLAEGIASYLQYQVMYANHILSWSESIARYKERFQQARREPVAKGMSIQALGETAGKRGIYVRFYWGGAAYFMQVDQRLHEERNMRLIDVIRDYMYCCSNPKGSTAEALIEEFDRLSGSSIFSETYRRTVSQPGFPDTSALAWLAENPPRIMSR